MPLGYFQSSPLTPEKVLFLKMCDYADSLAQEWGTKGSPAQFGKQIY